MQGAHMRCHWASTRPSTRFYQLGQWLLNIMNVWATLHAMAMMTMFMETATESEAYMTMGAHNTYGGTQTEESSSFG